MLLHQQKQSRGRHDTTKKTITSQTTPLYTIDTDKQGVKFVFVAHPTLKSFVVKKQINFEGLKFGDIVDTEFHHKQKNLEGVGCREFLGQIWINDHKIFLNMITRHFPNQADGAHFKRVLAGHMGIHWERIMPEEEVQTNGYHYSHK